MSNRFNFTLVGLVNQPQIRIKQRDVPNFVNYVLLGIINQPQFRLDQKGENENMEDDAITPETGKEKDVQVRVQGGSSGAVYGLGMIGACIYYISRGETTQEKARGFLKAMVWPVFVVKGILEFLEKE
jgi:hypothetical protein